MVRVLKLVTPHQVKRAKRNNQLLLCEAPKCMSPHQMPLMRRNRFIFLRWQQRGAFKNESTEIIIYSLTRLKRKPLFFSLRPIHLILTHSGQVDIKNAPLDGLITHNMYDIVPLVVLQLGQQKFEARGSKKKSVTTSVVKFAQNFI